MKEKGNVLLGLFIFAVLGLLMLVFPVGTIQVVGFVLLGGCIATIISNLLEMSASGEDS